MTDDFTNDWMLTSGERNIVYSFNAAFETSFRSVGKEFEYEHQWEFIKCLGLKEHNLNTLSEEQFYNTLSEFGCLDRDSLTGVWDIATKSLNIPTYVKSEAFEFQFDDLSYDYAFSSLTKSKIRFSNSEVFEEHFNDLIKTVETTKRRHL